MKNIQVTEVANGYVLNWQDNSNSAQVAVGTEVFTDLGTLLDRIKELLG